jgi:hypothetical protein
MRQQQGQQRHLQQQHSSHVWSHMMLCTEQAAQDDSHRLCQAAVACIHSTH